MKRIAMMTVILGWGLFLTSVGADVPAPSEVAVTWELDTYFPDPIKPIEVVLPGDTEPTTFWYLRYLVTNEGDDEVTFIPQIELVTNTGQVVPSDTGTPTAVFEAIRDLHNQPLLRTLADITGPILVGADNAQAGVAIWPDFDPRAGSVEVYITGLSGETQMVDLPTPIEVITYDRDGNEVLEEVDEVILRKTLKLVYALPGTSQARLSHPAVLESESWVMR